MHTYGAHGALETTLDARGILRSRTLDVLDRVTQTSWMGDASLTVDQTWDDPLVDYSIGRLTAIARHGTSVDYEYDVFGRVTRDGDLTYVYDGNGNRVSVGYPGGTTATYGFDFADRHQALDVQVGADPPRTVVSAAGYLPSGPLASLTLGNGTVEARDFDSRYYPDAIEVAGTRSRTWDYQVDAVGNVTQIDDELACGTQNLVLSDLTVATTEVFESCTDLTVGPDFHVAAPADVTLRAAGGVGFENVVSVESGAVLRVEPGADLGPPQLTSRTFGYQDFQYYLNLADGPWGAYDWTYDRIGNRLSEDDDGTLDTYDYEANAATTPGNLARLDQIQLGVGGIRDYTFGTAGHLEQVAAGANVVNFTSDSEGRLAGLERLGNTATMRYDGRSFLTRVDEGGTGNFVEPTYSSEGTLFSLFGSDDGGATSNRRHVLYFTGRPVAILEMPTSGAETCNFLSTDHLGTPFVASDDFGVEVWSGGFEPFGRDWLEGTPEGAQENGVFLRFPGQWVDEAWAGSSLGAEVAYNVHRWYESGSGRYNRIDPAGIRPQDLNLTLYTRSNPIRYSDRFGLEIEVDTGLVPFVDCARLNPMFDIAWEWFKANGEWTLQPLTASPHGDAQVYPPGEDYGVPDCAEGGRIFPNDGARRMLPPGNGQCQSVVTGIAHEVIETWAHCTLGISPREAHIFVQRGPKNSANGLDNDIGSLACADCRCRAAEGSN